MITSVQKIVLLMCLSMLVVVGAFAVPKQKVAHAIGGVWVDTSFDFNSIMDNQKNFVWDRLATLFAKQLLHQMTASVVNWINGGFQGSPAFVTDPESFFLDAADQMTGQFIREGGPLSKLCSTGLSNSIRLALALDQTISASKRYECTLGKMVNNVRGTVEGFTGGDFSQGGWPAFVSLSIEPQNNAYGSYLQAHSELLTAIGVKQDSINMDINRGHGFLTYPNCKDVTSQMSDPSSVGLNDTDFDQLTSTGRASAGYGANGASISVKTKYDSKTGNTTVQRCTNETPGSVISGLLGKQLQGPATELELADNINAVVNALVSQMVTQVLSGGLRGLSKGGSGSQPSYTAQIIRELNTSQETEVQNAGGQLSTVFDPAIQTLIEYKGIYDQAITLASSTRSTYISIRTCYASTSNVRGSGAQYQLNQISQIISGTLNPLITQLIEKQTDASIKLIQIQNSKSRVTATTNGVQGQLPGYQASVQSAIDVNTQTATKIPAAQKELADIQTQMQKLNNDAIGYRSQCRN